MADDPKYVIRFAMAGGEQTRKEAADTARSVEQSAGRMGGAFERIGQRADGLDSGFKKLNRGVGDARGAIELLGGAVPGLDGAFNILSRTIGNTADVFGTLSSLFTRNPIGLAAAGIAAVAAAYFAFSASAKDATAIVAASGAGAGQAAIEWQKLVDPMKTIAGLIDEIKAKQVAAVGGSRAAVDLSIADKQAKLADTERQLKALGDKITQNSSSTSFATPDAAARQAQVDALKLSRSSQYQQQLKDVAALRVEIGKLEGEQRKLDQLTRTFKAQPGEDANNVEGLRRVESDRASYARERAEAGKAAAEEQKRQVDSLVASYAPAIKAEQDYSKARADAIRLMEARALTGRQYEEVLRGISKAEFEATEAGREVERVRAFGAKVVEEVKTAEERYAEALRDTAAAQSAGVISAEQANRKRELETKRLKDATNEAGEEAKRNKEIGRELGLTFQSAFEDAIVRGKKFGDVLKGIGEDIARMIIRFTITIPLARALSETLEGIGGGGSSGGGGGGLFGGLLGGIGKGVGGLLGGLFGGGGSVSPGDPTGGLGPAFLAKGGALERGNIIPFAMGGIVDRPTIFPMARGAGLMGEAGPEAVVPLRRGPGGRLGIDAVGGGGAGAPVIQISNTIDARGADKSLRDALPALLRQNSEQTIEQIGRMLDRGGSFSRKSGRRTY